MIARELDMEVLVEIHEEKGLMSICSNTPILVRYEIIGIFAVNCKINGFMTQKIKFSLYGFLFRFFSFFADKTGGNIFFVKPKILLGSFCDREAIRVAKLMPKWTPATQNGKACKMYYNLPIIFRGIY